MKNIKFYIIAITSVLSLVISSCKETPPYINMVPANFSSDSTSLYLPAPTPQEKHVLIEEFSGVQCKNCPTAQAEAATISANNPGKIHVITIHALGINTPLTKPFEVKDGDQFSSKYDFRTFAGAKLFELTGVTNILPIGCVNRKLFPSETARNIDNTKWSANVNSELAVPSPVNINLTAKNIGDSISIDVTLMYTSTVIDTPNYLTLSVIESGMIDYQESTDANGKAIYVENYTHKHVLRGIVTDYYGDILKAKLEPGRIFFRRYTYKRDAGWDPKNLAVVALVHLNTSKQTVLQSAEAPVE